MASKPASNRRSPAPKKSQPVATQYNPEDDAEDSLAYEHGFLPDEDEEEGEAGYLTHASQRVREFTRQREGRVVVAALATGFAIGAAIGCLIAGSRERKQSWTDRLACEGLGRRLLDRFGSSIPDSITERFTSS